MSNKLNIPRDKVLHFSVCLIVTVVMGVFLYWASPSVRNTETRTPLATTGAGGTYWPISSVLPRARPSLPLPIYLSDNQFVTHFVNLN